MMTIFKISISTKGEHLMRISLPSWLFPWMNDIKSSLMNSREPFGRILLSDKWDVPLKSTTLASPLTHPTANLNSWIQIKIEKAENQPCHRLAPIVLCTPPAAMVMIFQKYHHYQLGHMPIVCKFCLKMLETTRNSKIMLENGKII